MPSVPALAPVAPSGLQTWYGPRRLALRAEVQAQVAATSTIERGPRANAPEQALTGFLRKHNATKDQLRQEGDYWVLEKSSAAVSAAELIAGAMPGVLRRFPWPKSMRWGESSFIWVRPLRRIICLLDGEIVPFDLRDGADDGHGLASGNLTEGHRFHAPDAFTVSSAATWKDGLTERRVLVDVDDRKRVIADRIAGLAAERDLTVVDDPGLLDEVAGLVEWPVPHLGRICGRTHGPSARGDAGLHAGEPALFRAAHRRWCRRPLVRLRREHPGGRQRRRPSSPATNVSFAPASPTLDISGTWTARRALPTACRGWAKSPSTPGWARRGSGCCG